MGQVQKRSSSNWRSELNCGGTSVHSTFSIPPVITNLLPSLQVPFSQRTIRRTSHHPLSSCQVYDTPDPASVSFKFSVGLYWLCRFHPSGWRIYCSRPRLWLNIAAQFQLTVAHLGHHSPECVFSLRADYEGRRMVERYINREVEG